RAVLVFRDDHVVALVVRRVVDVAEVVGAARGVEDQGTTIVGEGIGGVGELDAYRLLQLLRYSSWWFCRMVG
ncbi:MAG TPA: hypothetical protein VNA27_06005, partial [Rubrobacteraceae bacterium]|nr:hypothetical protein [Rubrobacteraceae bacterium]